MVEKLQVYKCDICGNMVEVLSAGGGTLTCCGKAMVVLNENTVDAAVEKHVQIYEKVEDELVVRVGEIEHPMEKEHYMHIAINMVYGKQQLNKN